MQEPEEPRERQAPREPGRWSGRGPDPITVAKEGWYEQLLRRVPLTVKKLDIIIAALVVLLVAALVLGTLKGNGLL